MPLTGRAMIGLAPLAVVMLATGCGDSTTVRLKLSLEIDVYGEIKRASSVFEQNLYKVIFPESANRAATTGEALYLDLGESRKPIVALLNLHRGLNYGPWGTGAALKAYGVEREVTPDGARLHLKELARMRGVRDVPFDVMPQFVTFANPLDPTTVEAVDPNDLEASLGSGVKWHRVKIEVTNEDITEGVIEERLPWLKGMGGGTFLDCKGIGNGATLANTLQRPDFLKDGF